MVEVSAGIIVSDSKILCFQKGEARYPYLSFKYEFPGGKVEPGEDPRDTIIRELSEELKMDISNDDIIHLCDTSYDYPDFSVTLHSFLIFKDDVRFTLTEHISYVWSELSRLDSLDWAEADKAIVKAVKDHGAIRDRSASDR